MTIRCLACGAVHATEAGRVRGAWTRFEGFGITPCPQCGTCFAENVEEPNEIPAR